MSRAGAPSPYRSLSLWHDTLVAAGEDDLRPRPSLDGDLDVDVCVVGAGYTGLWTAYSLLAADPGLRVAVLEAQIAGFGASGRNGGWCSALFPASTAALARRHGRAAALAMRRAMNDTVAEVGRVVAAEASATSSRVRPVAGSTTGHERPEVPVTRRPAIQLCPGPPATVTTCRPSRNAISGRSHGE